MRAPYTPYLFVLALLGALVGSAERAEAFGYGYRANDPVQIDRCYRSPAWDYAAAYYSSRYTARRYYKGAYRCYRGLCCRK